MRKVRNHFCFNKVIFTQTGLNIEIEMCRTTTGYREAVFPSAILCLFCAKVLYKYFTFRHSLIFLCMRIRWKRNGGTKAKRTGLQVRILISQKQMQMPLIVPDPESIKLYLVCQVPTRINCLMRVVTQLLTKALQNLWHLSKITFAKMGLMMGVSWLHIVKLCFRVAASSGTGVEWACRTFVFIPTGNVKCVEIPVNAISRATLSFC